MSEIFLYPNVTFETGNPTLTLGHPVDQLSQDKN